MSQQATSKKQRIQYLEEQLKGWRAEQQALRKKVDQARKELRSLGQDPDRRFDLAPRNQRIYELIRKGISFAEVGEEFGLTKERVRQLFQRVEKQVMIKKYQEGKPVKKLQ